MLNTEDHATERQQAEWDAVAKERETGVAPAAEKPPVAAKPESAAVATSEETKPDPLQEFRDQFAKIEQRQRNVEGHIGGLNHNLKLMQETMQAASKAAAQQVANAPTQAQVKGAMTRPADWDELKSQFPEWATATEKFMDARLAALSQATQSWHPDAIAKMVNEQVAGQSDAVRNEIVHTALDAMYPDWRDDVKTEQFAIWLAAQSSAIKAMADSNSIKDAAKMLRLYETDKAANPAAAIIASRKQKLAAAAGAPKGVRVPPAKAEADMSAQELWNLEASRRERQRSARAY